MARKPSITLVSIALIALSGLTVSGSASATGVMPIKKDLPVNFGFAVDGTDLYWLDDEIKRDRARHKWVFNFKLMRGSLLNKSVKKLTSFDGDSDLYPESMLAGGGAVYMNLSNEDLESDRQPNTITRVIRIPRDGSSVQTVASGAMTVAADEKIAIDRGKALLNDCGTMVEATSISNVGDIVVSELTSERDSKLCGREKNSDHWRYYELTPTGATREIVSEHIKVANKLKVHGKRILGTSGPDRYSVADPWVYFGKAVYELNHAGEYYVRNLATGVVTGPFQTKIKGTDFYAAAQVNSLGQLVTSAFSITNGGTRREKANQVSRIFRAPGDPNSYARIPGEASVEFCGDHLISVNRRGAREIDPTNFLVERILAGSELAKGLTLIEPPCNDRFVYFTRHASGKDVLYAYPLD